MLATISILVNLLVAQFDAETQTSVDDGPPVIEEILEKPPDCESFTALVKENDIVSLLINNKFLGMKDKHVQEHLSPKFMKMKGDKLPLVGMCLGELKKLTVPPSMDPGKTKASL